MVPVVTGCGARRGRGRCRGYGRCCGCVDRRCQHRWLRPQARVFAPASTITVRVILVVVRARVHICTQAVAVSAVGCTKGICVTHKACHCQGRFVHGPDTGPHAHTGRGCRNAQLSSSPHNPSLSRLFSGLTGDGKQRGPRSGVPVMAVVLAPEKAVVVLCSVCVHASGGGGHPIPWLWSMSWCRCRGV